jgi:hypothetical protein
MVGAAHVSHADVQPAVATKVVGACTLVTALDGASPASAESCAEESACDEEQAAKRQLASGSAKDQERCIETTFRGRVASSPAGMEKTR